MGEIIKKPNRYGLKPGEEVVMEVRKGTQGISPEELKCFDYIRQRNVLDEKGHRIEGNMAVIIGGYLR